MKRLGPQPGEVIDRTRSMTFSWNGTPYRGYAGDTIASALAAAGVNVYSRSFKYHRPRGLLTADYWDPGCTVQVGDEPNVRGAHRLLAEAMDVRAQNVMPSLRFDVRATNQLLHRFLTAGFYYKTFIKPQRLWPLYERVLQRFAAGGRLPATPPTVTYDKRYVHSDVLVAGAGPAGMAAAVAAAQAGASVVLVEHEHDLGGHLRYGGPVERGALDELRASVRAAGIEVMVDSTVAGRYDDNWVAVVQRSPEGGERLVKARAGVLVVAAGLLERPYVFDGNDRPGVLLSSAVRRLINLWAVRPGERAVVFTANASGDAAVDDLARVGVDVAAVVDAREGGEIIRARGRGRAGVRAVELAGGQTIECDLLVTAVGWTAPTALLNMSGDHPVYVPRAARFVSGGRLPAGVVVTGGLLGDGNLDQLVDHGKAVGIDAAHRALGGGGGGGVSSPAVPELALDDHPELFCARTSGFIDFNEDVTTDDIIAAAAEGYDSIELVKRYTTVTMGGNQGKLETVNTVAALAAATGRTIADTGTTVWRPPYSPITLGALAGTHRSDPFRLSPMQPWHKSHGAVPLVAGQWIRPDHYGDAAAEVRNVRSNVGIIDVTPLGKLDLRGPDVAALLNLLYINKWSKLAVGAVRYGVMCADDGVVLDDGVCGRIGPEHYLMTTTSSGAATVWEWVENWLQTEHPEWDVHVTPVTTAWASINVAGPRSRQLLERICADVDLDAAAFAYMQVRRAQIAGVDDCFMWRIGFTGELSFEIHVPAGYGLHVWETLLEAGSDLGCAPFGVEAQRILRLEKGHLIVGQDTDGLTTAYAAGLDAIVKLDKEDFCGLPELAWRSAAGEEVQLVGLHPIDPTIVPAESSQIIDDGSAIVGRITSSRMSPTLGRAICLALLARRLTTAGTVVTVQLPDGRRIPARVNEHPASFDPGGERLRG